MHGLSGRTGARFNPYSGGLAISARCVFYVRWAHILFQSLFWWISHFGRGLAGYSSTGATEFQSLFWWISHFGQSCRFGIGIGFSSFNPYSGGLAISAPMRQTGLDLLASFNPYSGGLAISAIHAWIIRANRRPFQSLFWWISHFGLSV